MKSVLEDYLSDQNKGLLLLDMPTGSGKTYSIVDYIATHIDTLKDSGRKIVFITPLKKNLPTDELRNRLKIHSKAELFDREVLLVQSTIDAFVEHFASCEYYIKDMFPDFDCYTVNEALKGLSNQALKTILESLISRKGSELSKIISLSLRESFTTTEDRIEAIQTDPKWQWVAKLFPATLTTERTVLFMSVSKFIYPYQTIVQPLKPISELLMEYHTTLFIDEVDSSKQFLQNYIIEQGLTNTIEPVPTVRQIASRLRESRFPTSLLPEHLLDKQPANPHEVETSIREKSQDIVDTYEIGLNLKSRGNDNQHSFIFYDKETHYLADANDKIVTIKPDYEHNNLWIELHKKDRNKKGDEITLGQLLSRNHNFIEYFKGGLSMLANNYYYQRRNTTGISFEDAARSYLDFFHLPDATVKQLLNEIQYKRLAQAWRSTPAIVHNEILPSARLYEHGFTYHSISNSESHAGRSKVLSFNFPCTAEFLLLNWCREFMVVGVSATANIKSRLGNYDLHYLQSTLETIESAHFYKLGDSERQALDDQFALSKSGYGHIDIQTHWHGLSEGLSTNEIEHQYNLLFKVGQESGADQDDVADFMQKINELHGDGQYLYKLSQYYKIFELWVAYLKHNNMAFLLLFGKGYRNKELELIQEFCNLLVDVYQLSYRSKPCAKKEIVSIVGRSSTDDLERVKSELAEGKHRFVLSTYATLGAGINIQFPIPKDKANTLIKINDFTADTNTDFDAIYLDKPTHVLVNTNGGNSLKAIDLVKHIYQLEYLKISGLTYSDFHHYLQRAFMAHIGRRSFRTTTDNIYRSADYRLHIMQLLIQAVGRICRTNMKSPTIHMHLDRRIASEWLDDLGDMPLLPEFHEIQHAVNISLQSNNVLVNAVISKNMIKIREAIFKMLTQFNQGLANSNTIDQWQLIRDICLTHPQFNENTDAKYSFFYTDFDHPRSAYYYLQDNDYRTIDILNEPEYGSITVSEASAKLNTLMAHSGLKRYFESMGYATTLPASKYWLQPILFNNIYKGALGEVCGAYLWRSYELPALQELPQNQYESFDFMINEDVFIDFKHWSLNWKDGKQERNKIFDKMQRINAKLVFIINIISEIDSISHNVFISNDGSKQIVEVPKFLFEDLPDIELINFISNKISEINNAN